MVKIFTKILVESDVPESLIEQALIPKNIENYKKDITDSLNGEVDENCTFFNYCYL